LSRRELGTGWKGLLKATGWSLLFGIEGFVLSLLAYVVIGTLALGGFDADWFSVVGLRQTLAQGAGFVLGFGFATRHLGRHVLGLSWEELRWRGVGPRGSGFGRGAGLGGMSAALAMLLGLVVAGAAWFTGEGTFGGWLGSAGWTAAALSLPALSEEIIFRGVPLILLAGVIGRWPAVVATSALFALAHVANPDVTWLGIANIALAGVLLGTLFYAPGGIWAAWGAHLGWNLSLAALGAPVSGLPLSIPYLQYNPGGPDWVTGGAFGPEGGILASAAMLAAIAVAGRWISKGEGRT